MVVQKIDKSTLTQALTISAISFNWNFNPHTFDVEESIQQKENSPNSPSEQYWKEQWVCLEDEKVIGCVGAFPYPVYFDGHVVNMSGIGGVCTLPEYRRQGVIRKCFETIFPYMKDQKQLFSVLYPFYIDYYRQFGYELFGKITTFETPLKDIPKVPVTGTILSYTESRLKDIEQIYIQFASQYNLAVQRRTVDWKRLTNLNPPEQQIFGYVYYDNQKTPKGYVFFHKEIEQNEAIMVCSQTFRPYEFCFTDQESFLQLLQFLQNFHNYYQKLRFQTPESIDVSYLFPNGVSEKHSTPVMLRAIDVEEIFKIAKYQGSRKAFIEIQDQQIPDNCGTWEVCFENGSAVTVLRHQDKPADIRLSIGAFSSLIVGTHDLCEIEYLKGVTLLQNHSDLSKVFYRKKNWIGDFF